VIVIILKPLEEATLFATIALENGLNARTVEPIKSIVQARKMIKFIIR